MRLKHFLLLALTLPALAAAPPTPPPAPAATPAPPEKKDPDARKKADQSRAILDRNAAAHPPAFSIDIGQPHRMEASLALAAAAPRMKADEYIIFGPLPPETDAQSHIAYESTIKPVEVREPAGLHRPILMWRITPEDPSKKMVTLAIQYTLDLAPRTLTAKPAGSTPAAAPGATSGATPAADPRAKPLTTEERTSYTAPGYLADYDAVSFQAWLAESALRPTATETEIDFARRVFLFIKEKSTFEFHDKIERRASIVRKTMKTDCDGLTALFVAVLRANGLPARQMIGRWALSARKDEKLDGQDWQQEHIKTEFFAAGVGWVPVDMSLAVAYDKKPNSTRHFGLDIGDFVTLHIEPDIRVNTIHFGQKIVSLLQEPVFWVKGTGSMADAVARSDWQVLPAKPKAK